MSERATRDLQRLRERVSESTELCSTDRETLKTLDEDLKTIRAQSGEIDISRHKSVLHTSFLIARGTQRLTESLSESTGADAVDEITAWVSSKSLTGNSKDSYYNAFRKFASVMLDIDDADDLPERFAALKTSHATNNPTPSASDILRWSDVIPLIEAREEYNYRDPAILAVQWSSGGRPESELWNLTWGDVEDRGDHVLLSIPEDTKTGARDVYLYVGAPYLRRWKEHHPAHDDGGLTDSTLVWTKITRNESISYTQYAYPFYEARDAVDITKPCNPRNLRRSRASVLASRTEINQVDLENHFGWQRGSDAAGHYISAFAGETGKHIAAADGHPVDESDSRAKIAPVKCLECGEYTPRHRETCLWCPAPVEASIDEQDTLRHVSEIDADRNLLELVMDEEVNADDLRAVKKLEPVLRSEPETLLDRTDELIQMAEGYKNASA